jgi:hypothetical protein
VVGEVADTASQARRGAVWSTGGPTRKLLPPSHRLTDVNDVGVAVGFRDDTLVRVPIRWTAAGGVTDLATPGAGTNMEATAVNNAGVAVGVRQYEGHRMAVRFLAPKPA